MTEHAADPATDQPTEPPALPPQLETVWLIEATYAPDAAETRVPFRAAHLARAAELKRAGVIVEIGAFLDVSSSIVLIRAESEAAAMVPIEAAPEGLASIEAGVVAAVVDDARVRAVG